ncbi:hypothetical protein [Haloferula sp. BvORR071]|uniref:hypothetical protein n=1 Tax=Haloferula sp. BvORR071 TaxID=1396141 RepID=UPI00224100BB|nr:hypothetical protein [Haloferula sp. BvORR071]
MSASNLHEVSVSLNDEARAIKVLFGHLPRVGETLTLQGTNYEVQKVVFDLIEGDGGRFGHPSLFCRPATLSLGGDSATPAS